MENTLNKHSDIIKMIKDKYEVEHSNTSIMSFYDKPDKEFLYTKLYLFSTKIKIEFDYQSKIKWKKDYGKIVTKTFKCDISDQIVIEFYDDNIKLNVCAYYYHIIDENKYYGYYKHSKYDTIYSLLSNFEYFSAKINNEEKLLKLLLYLNENEVR